MNQIELAMSNPWHINDKNDTKSYVYIKLFWLLWNLNSLFAINQLRTVILSLYLTLLNIILFIGSSYA